MKAISAFFHMLILWLAISGVAALFLLPIILGAGSYYLLDGPSEGPIRVLCYIVAGLWAMGEAILLLVIANNNSKKEVDLGICQLCRAKLDTAGK